MRLGKKVKSIYESNMSYQRKADELYKLGFSDLEIWFILKDDNNEKKYDS